MFFNVDRLSFDHNLKWWSDDVADDVTWMSKYYFIEFCYTYYYTSVNDMYQHDN